MAQKTPRSRVISYVITVILSVLFIFFGHNAVMKRYPDEMLRQKMSQQSIERARVIEILEVKDETDELSGNVSLNMTITRFSALLLTGDRKGKTVEATHTIDIYSSQDETRLNKGDKVLLLKQPNESLTDYDWHFAGFSRAGGIVFLAVIFAVLLLFFGRFKGLNTLISLVFTCLAVFLVFVPSVLAGINLYFSSVTICVFITLMTLSILGGIGKKSIAAALGTLSGLLVSGITTLIMDAVLKLTGIISDESVYLIFLNPDNPINMRAVIFSAIIIGASGAVLDTAMSISSALSEVADAAGKPRFKDIFRSGLNIGRDTMGTMTNTLILVYIGSSMATVLLLVAYNSSFRLLFNRELIVVEMLQALAGSLGILAAIPLTALIGAWFFRQDEK